MKENSDSDKNSKQAKKYKRLSMKNRLKFVRQSKIQKIGIRFQITAPNLKITFGRNQSLSHFLVYMRTQSKTTRITTEVATSQLLIKSSSHHSSKIARKNYSQHWFWHSFTPKSSSTLFWKKKRKWCLFVMNFVSRLIIRLAILHLTSS